MDSFLLKSNNITDESIVISIQNGNFSNFELLAERYNELIKIKALQYHSYGFDANDFFQEGLFALFNAAKTYNYSSKKASFKTYASVCINRSLALLYRYSNRNKNKCFHSALSVNDDVEKATEFSVNPEEIILANEAYSELKEKISQLLDDNQKLILSYYLDGKSYKEIAELLHTNTKAIDNSLQRIRNKLKKSNN